MSLHVHVIETEAEWQAALAEANERLRRGEADIARYEAKGFAHLAAGARQANERLRKAVEEISRDRAAAIAAMPRCQCSGGEA